MGRLSNLEQIRALDPLRDHQRIVHLLACYEFPFDLTRALEFALFRTFCVPSIGGLLDRTGEFVYRAQKRYDDTDLIVSELLEWGYDSPRGQAALRRMNQLHGRFVIRNEDFVYVLSTFVFEPIRWNERFGWRRMCEQERLGLFHFWREVGRRMNLKDVPGDFGEFERCNLDYERTHFRYTEANHRVGAATLEMFASWFPGPLRPLVRSGMYALMDDPVLEGFGFPRPSRLMQRLVPATLRLRARLLRWLPPRRRPACGPRCRTAPTRADTSSRSWARRNPDADERGGKRIRIPPRLISDGGKNCSGMRPGDVVKQTLRRTPRICPWIRPSPFASSLTGSGAARTRPRGNWCAATSPPSAGTSACSADRRLRRVLESVDICQSVLANFFVRAAAGQFDLEDPGQLLKLLATMAQNKVRNKARDQRAARRDHRRELAGGGEALQGVADGGPSPSATVAAKELLRRVLDRLTPEERSLAEGRAHGRDWGDLAAEAGQKPDALRKRLSRAMDRVAEELGLEEITLGIKLIPDPVAPTCAGTLSQQAQGVSCAALTHPDPLRTSSAAKHASECDGLHPSPTPLKRERMDS